MLDLSAHFLQQITAKIIRPSGLYLAAQLDIIS
jgi:hypothetical protein